MLAGPPRDSMMPRESINDLWDNPSHKVKSSERDEITHDRLAAGGHSGAIYREIAHMKDEDIGRRLKLAAMAMGYKSVRSFAQFLEIDENQLGKYIRGKRRITVEPVNYIAYKTTFTIDFLYRDDRRGLSPTQVAKLAEVEQNFEELNREWTKRSRQAHQK